MCSSDLSCVARKGRRLHGLPGWRLLVEVPRVHLVDLRVVVHVGQKDLAAHDVFERHARGLQDRADVVEDALGFRFDRAVNHAAGVRINGNLAGDVEPIVDEDSLAVRADGRRRKWRRDGTAGRRSRGGHVVEQRTDRGKKTTINIRFSGDRKSVV